MNREENTEPKENNELEANEVKEAEKATDVITEDAEKKPDGTKRKKGVKIIAFVLAALTLAAGIGVAAYAIIRKQPDSVAKRTLKEIMTYSFSECGFFDGGSAADQLQEAMSLSKSKLDRTGMTENCKNQILSSDLPRRLAKLSFDSESDIKVKKIEITTESAADGSCTLGFEATLKVKESESRITGTLILISQENEWICDYFAVISFE